MPIVDLQRRLHEVGRIRIGTTVPTERGRRPTKLTTFRITSQDRRALERVAALYGGTVERWQDAPIGEQWEVTTGTAELRVAVPPERMALSQWMELWSGGGCVRRCDGVQQTNDDPCLCTQLDGDDPTPRCSRHTRLSLMLADLATSGLWRLDTQGFYASVELAGALELSQLVVRATGRGILPGWLRLEQREVRRPGEQVKRFPVPVLDLEMDAGALTRPSNGTGTAPLPPPGEEDDEPSAGLTPIPARASALADELDRTPPAPRRAGAPLPDDDLEPLTAAQMREEDATSAQGAPTPQLGPARVGRPAGSSGPPNKPTDAQRRKLFALLKERGMSAKPERLRWVNTQIERIIESYNDLTAFEASQLIDTLEEMGLADPPDAQQNILDADPGPER